MQQPTPDPAMATEPPVLPAPAPPASSSAQSTKSLETDAEKGVAASTADSSDLSSQEDGVETAPAPKTRKQKLKERSILLLPIFLAAILATIIALALVFSTHPKSRQHVGASTIHLPSFPLAVRTPYLHSWLPGDASKDVTTGQPEFWDGTHLTWNVLARVAPSDNPSKAQTYSLFGLPKKVANVKAASQQGTINHTSTHTTIALTAGEASFTLSFFSPVSPLNYTRQSMPYSYLTVTASANSSSDIQIFSAIDGSWTGETAAARGNVSTEQGSTYFSIANPKQILFTEHGQGQALWGTSVHASQANQSSQLDSACASNETLFSDFVKSGTLSGTQCGEGDSYALVHHLQDVTSAQPVTYAVGMYQEEAINFHNVTQTPYFRSEYPDIPSSLAAFFDDYEAALAESVNFDNLIVTQGNEISANYTQILVASVRQAFAAIQITIPADTLSTDPTDVNGFLKEISSDGNVNSIDVIYPTFPMFYVLAPDYIRLCLQPVLSYLATPTGVWSLPEVPHDLGDHYPNATGHDNNELEFFFGREENMPLESTGFLMHMLLSYTNATGDYDFVRRFMGPDGKYLLTTYADYLVSNGTYPDRQLTTVDALPMSSNITQLAVTSALGISAMGAMANMTNYTTAGAELTNKILTDKDMGALSPNGSVYTYNYGHFDTFSVMFPLFVDKLWGLAPANSFSSSFEAQSDFYASQLAADPLGLPFSNFGNWAITDWNMWAATFCSSNVTTSIIDSTYEFLVSTQSDVPFGTKYVVGHPQKDEFKNEWLANKARPTVGSNFALLALKGAGLTW